MADRSSKPLKSSELEEDARREDGPRGTEAFKDCKGDEASDLRKREEQAVETSLTRLPPG